jgi:DNA (cytosine-5)-methyltransferase 1
MGTRAPTLRLHYDESIVDSFAGGGGASLGMKVGLGREPDIAINHDREAIAMHAANHPGTKHYCEDIWKVDPREACRGRRPAFAWFSPDCKHFSKAKGGKPVDKNIRGLAWIVLVWAKTVKPRVIALENVEEFEDWGPLGPDNMPDRARRGLTFRIWKGKLEAQGYKVEVRELVAAKYGAATTRNRLYVIARCDGLPIVWPTEGDGLALTWRRIAADCIDWALPTYSIFLTREEAKQYNVKRPLAENTMRRVYRGFEKFVMNNPRPYLMTLNHGGGKWHRARGLDEPMRTLTGSHDAHALLSPYLAGVGGRKGQSPETGVDRPYHTITAKGDTCWSRPTWCRATARTRTRRAAADSARLRARARSSGPCRPSCRRRTARSWSLPSSRSTTAGTRPPARACARACTRSSRARTRRSLPPRW